MYLTKKSVTVSYSWQGKAAILTLERVLRRMREQPCGTVDGAKWSLELTMGESHTIMAGVCCEPANLTLKSSPWGRPHITFLPSLPTRYTLLRLLHWHTDIHCCRTASDHVDDVWDGLLFELVSAVPGFAPLRIRRSFLRQIRLSTKKFVGWLTLGVATPQCFYCRTNVLAAQ